MLLSVFTPTNNLTWLSDCYQSLCNQTYQNWEWVVLPNGPREWEITEYLTKLREKDPRVEIVKAPMSASNIGAFKRATCFEASGDVFIELDHDDELMPTCLEKVAQAVKDGAGFVYSDGLTWNADGSTDHYDCDHGWEGYMVDYKGAARMCYKSFEPSPRSFSEIFYAPNHVRAWTREIYEKAGGHDYTLEVCDDHDLLCRTYLTECKITHIQECLYAYRTHPQNTSRVKNKLVQKLQAQIYNKYLEQMVETWSRFQNLSMIDLGGAHDSPGDPWLALDMHPGPDVAFVCNVLDGLPFGDNTVGAFRAHDFLEHIPSDKIPFVMNEMYRCLADGGWIFASCPAVAAPDGTAGFGAYQDPTHKSFWIPNSWWYYTDSQYSRFVPELKCRFQAARTWHGFPSEMHEKHRIPYVQADLVAVKGNSRPPGILRI